MSLYNKNEEMNMNPPKTLGSLGKTKIDKTEFQPTIKSNKKDKAYNSHEISFQKEKDRLVLKGTFKKGTDVKVLLYKDLKVNYYHISISKKPYTALCVDVFTEEETEKGLTITRYINQEGLKGKYSIYVSIDGKIYNTEEYVNFS